MLQLIEKKHTFAASISTNNNLIFYNNGLRN
jgi:hypothetical protein